MAPLQSKVTVYAAIAGVLAMMGGIVYYASLDNAKLEQAEIRLAGVELVDVNTLENRAKLEVTFLVSNPSDKTFTVSQIGYELSGDGEVLGTGQYSTADIALPGRAVFYSGAEVPLKSLFHITRSEATAGAYDSVVGGLIGGYSASGSITTETSWSINEKEFESILE